MRSRMTFNQAGALGSSESSATMLIKRKKNKQKKEKSAVSLIGPAPSETIVK